MRNTLFHGGTSAPPAASQGAALLGRLAGCCRNVWGSARAAGWENQPGVGTASLPLVLLLPLHLLITAVLLQHITIQRPTAILTKLLAARLDSSSFSSFLLADGRRVDHEEQPAPAPAAPASHSGRGAGAGRGAWRGGAAGGDAGECFDVTTGETTTRALETLLLIQMFACPDVGPTGKLHGSVQDGRHTANPLHGENHTAATQQPHCAEWRTQLWGSTSVEPAADESTCLCGTMCSRDSHWQSAKFNTVNIFLELTWNATSEFYENYCGASWGSAATASSGIVEWKLGIFQKYLNEILHSTTIKLHFCMSFIFKKYIRILWKLLCSILGICTMALIRIVEWKLLWIWVRRLYFETLHQNLLKSEGRAAFLCRVLQNRHGRIKW